MSTPSYALGVDFGGGGVRCLLLEPRSGETHHAVRPCAQHRTTGTGGLGADLDLAEIWQALASAVREVMDRAGATPADIAGIAATSMRLGSVVIDRDGNSILAVPNVDARAAGEGLRMAAEHGEMLYPRTGHWPVPVMAAPRLQWLSSQRPDDWKRAAHYFSISDWLCWRLSGRALADPSQASVTLLCRLQTQHGEPLAGGAGSDWDWDWIDELAFPRHVFPEMRESGTPAGALCDEAARDLGLLAGTPVAVGGADTQCGLLALGAVSHGQVCAVAGSTAPIQAVVESPIVEPNGRLWTARHVVPNRWVVESNAGPMGDAISWLARLLYPDAQEPIARLFGEAAGSEVGAAGQLSTLGTQVMNARAMAMPTGDLTLSHMSSAHDAAPRRHLVRAVSEGLACGLRANLEQLQAAIDSPLQSLTLGGGLARSASFCETLGEVLGATISVSQGRQESARGAALCGGVGADIWPTLEAAAKAAGAPRSELEPDTDRAAASQAVYANWIQNKNVRAEAEQLASQLTTPWVMAANDRAAVDARTTTRPNILVCADFDEASLVALRELGDVEYASYRDKMRMLSGASMVDAAAPFDVLVTEIDLLDSDSIAQLPKLRVVATCRGDAVNVDIAACTAYGIPVLNTPGRNADAVADLTLAFLLMLSRKLPSANRFLRQPGIEPGDMGKMGQAFSTLQGGELWHKTVGLVGLGAVGREVAQRLASFGARILVSDPFVSAEAAAVAGASLVSLDELLRTSDFVSLHAAVTDATRELIDGDALARMKPGACLVNTARAALTDEDALIAALENGQLAGLAVDTFSVEPPGSDHPLLSFPNVIATPHIGGNTREVAAHQGQILVSDLARLLTGERPKAILNPATLADFDWGSPRRQPSEQELEQLSSGDGPAVSDLQKRKEKPASRAQASRAAGVSSGEEPAPAAAEPSQKVAPADARAGVTTGSSSHDPAIAAAMRRLLEAFVAAITTDAAMRQAATKHDVTLHFLLTDLALEMWFGLAGGTVTGAVGPPAEQAPVQLRMAADIFDGMFSGTGNPMEAAMDGRLSFTGDAGKAMALQSLQADLSRLYLAACDGVGGRVDLSALAQAPVATARGTVSAGDPLLDELVATVDELYRSGVITATGGNVSVRARDRDAIWITPSQLFKGDLSAEVVVEIDFDGQPVGGASRSPSSEWPMHTAIFKRRPEVKAVVHAHAPHATILCNSELPFLPISTEAAFFGNITRIPFIMPGTDELAEAVAQAIGKDWAVMMQNHGILVAGRTLRRAADMVEIIERTAEVILGGYAVGRPPPSLPAEAAAKFRELGDLIA